MRHALAEAERGMAEGEAPIGCVIALPDPATPWRRARGRARPQQEQCPSAQNRPRRDRRL
jgi:tRNA(Arg) A34 adenosine deaminase TadA